MKAIFALCIIFLVSCSKRQNLQIIVIPNGDFENWTSAVLLNWETNSCPMCVPPYDPYTVKQETNAYSGHYAAKFIYNHVFYAWAINKFPLLVHPTVLSGYMKTTFTATDTALVKVNLYNNMLLADSGYQTMSSSISDYTYFEIPITQNNLTIDSAVVTIHGGKKDGTIFWLDNLYFIKR